MLEETEQWFIKGGKLMRLAIYRSTTGSAREGVCIRPISREPLKIATR